MAELKQLAVEYKLTASHFTGIGAFQSATVGFYDVDKKRYEKTLFREQIEVLSLVGDISLNGAEPQIHAHVVIGRADATAHGGHLLFGLVCPTLEVVLTESPVYLRRKYNPDVGLYLISLNDID